MQGVDRLAFPLSIDRNSDLAGGWGTRNGGIFHGQKGDWPHCILPNATWLFAEGTRVDVFDAEETTWDPPNPVLSERFVRLFRAVYGAVSAPLARVLSRRAAPLTTIGAVAHRSRSAWMRAAGWTW